jgi:predicted transcriptional regulator
MGIKNELYKKAALKQLYFNNTMSCAEISSLIGRSIPVTLKILEELVKEGIVYETGFAPSSGGRRPLMYALKGDVHDICCHGSANYPYCGNGYP